MGKGIQQSQSFQFRQPLLEGDVPGIVRKNLDRADNPPGFVTDRRGADSNRDTVPVLVVQVYLGLAFPAVGDGFRQRACFQAQAAPRVVDVVQDEATEYLLPGR